MQVAIWALLTCPEHFFVALWSDENVAKVAICSMIPLLLQDWIQEADVWACLLLLLLLLPTLETGHGL